MKGFGTISAPRNTAQESKSSRAEEAHNLISTYTNSYWYFGLLKIAYNCPRLSYNLRKVKQKHNLMRTPHVHTVMRTTVASFARNVQSLAPSSRNASTPGAVLS